MLIHSHLPQSFWSEALQHAAYIKHRLPHSAISYNTLFSLWHDQLITPIGHIRPFGCIVYAEIPKERRPRLSKYLPRAYKGCLLQQISPSMIKFYDFERKTTDTSHNFTIRENQYPSTSQFDQSTPATHPASPLLPNQTIYDSITVELLPAIKVFSTSIAESSDPLSYLDSMSRKDAVQWRKAMEEEIQSIIDNKTWELSDLPANRQVIGTKWVLKKKRDGNNNIIRHKARIVAKGYSQIAGLDFTETFAPVVRIESIRTLFSIVAFYNLYILHADAKTAFLNGNSDLELYVKQPEGFLDRSYPNKVLGLRKSLYGLKQATRIWYLLLCQHILNLGFKSCESDPSIYINIEKSIILSVYVDDILIFRSEERRVGKECRSRWLSYH